MNTIEEIKDRLDIVDIVSESVNLKRSGKNYTGFCPFHSNTRTPAFVVFPDTGTWRCFGQCSEGGDIYKFVMKREGWDFPETLKFLAERAGVQLRPQSPQEQARRDENEHLRTLLDTAVSFFQMQFKESPAGKKARQYLLDRGLQPAALEQFQLGYAPDSWDALLKFFSERGTAAEELIDAGLISSKENGSKHFDRFRHRVMFPIHDARGRMAGFGARALNPEDLAKYLNSPQTPVFDKSSLLYGLHHARQSIRSQDQVVIVEGYMDVIALHQAGYTNVVSPMGTALTEAQLRQLKRLTRRIVLALDADAAGANATLRGLQVARKTLDRQSDLTFNARGLLRDEARLKADIRVTTLPEGLDPDEVVNEDPTQWETILAAAKPVVVHVMETLAAGKDLDDPKVKTEIASQVLPLIQDLPSEIERDTYIQKLARFLHLHEDSLLKDQAALLASRRRRRRPSRPVSEGEDGAADEPLLQTHLAFKLESHSLGIIIRRPELIHRLNRAFSEAGLERITPDDFEHTDHQILFRLASESINQDRMEPLNYTLENLPSPMIDYADQILAGSKKLDPNEERVFEDLLRTILKLRRAKLQQGNQQLQILQAEALEHGDASAGEYQQAILKAVQTLNFLDKAIGKYTGSPILN